MLQKPEAATGAVSGRYRDYRGRTLAQHALELDCPAVLYCDPASDRQSEPGTSRVPGARRVCPIEPLEDVRECFGGNAHAAVMDRQARTISNTLESKNDSAGWPRVLDRVVDQQKDELPEPVWISNDSYWLERSHLEDLAVCQMTRLPQDIHQHSVELHGLATDLLASVSAGQRKQIGHETGEPIGLGGRIGKCVCAVLTRECRNPSEQLEIGLENRERRPQLV